MVRNCCYVAMAWRHANSYKGSMRICKGSVSLFRTLIWTNKITAFVIRYEKRDHSGYFVDCAFLVWIDSPTSTESSDAIFMKKCRS